MSQDRIGKHKAVFIKYLIKDESGQILEQSDIPIGYVHGCGGNLLEKIELELENHGAGDVVEVSVSPREGFGDHDPNLTFTDDVDNVPADLRYIGAEAQMQNEDGDVKTFIVTEIKDGKLTLDGNHPFAGKNVVFRVTITEVRDATPQEIANGCPDGQQPPTVH